MEEEKNLSPLELMEVFLDSKFMVVHFNPEFKESNNSPIIILSKWAKFDSVEFSCYVPPNIQYSSNEFQDLVIEDADFDSRTWNLIYIEHILQFTSKDALIKFFKNCFFYLF